MQLINKFSQSIRWRLGLPVAAPALEAGTDESVAEFYNQRVTECSFLEDAAHYEHPRAQWVLNQVKGGSLLEVGCGNGGMTRLLSPQVDRLTAFDVSAPSLRAVEELGLPNVTTAQGLMENYQPPQSFDWVVLSEVIEHLRKPADAVKICYGWVAPGGSLVITTPNGHWESDEHLHEFSMTSLTQILTPLEPESVKVEYLRDRENRRRWLTAVLQKASTPQTPDDFHNRQAVAQKRRQRFGK